MKVKVKPVGFSEIRDPAIARQAIAEVRRQPTAAELARMNELQESFRRVTAE
jgi:hypothetical protein